MSPAEPFDHETPADEWWHAPVPEHLSGLVSSVVGYHRLSGPPRVHRGLPSGSVTVILNVGEPVRVLAGAGADRFDTTVAGLHTTATLIDDTGTQEGVAIDLHPLGASTLLGVPTAALTGLAVELDELVGPGGRRLWESLQTPGTARSRAETCLRWLGARAARGADAPVEREVCRAWSLLEGSAGRARVDEIADDVGWSRQHLRRRFRAHVGLNPKETARILRFDASVRRLKARPDASFAAVAADCGFSDQAHLTNEWTRLAGCTPATWIATDLVPKVQDTTERPPPG